MSEPGFAANPHPLSEFDLHLINHGNHERLFEVLGCHLFDQGARFAVWAPNAQAVSVIGDFNGWAVDATPLRKIQGALQLLKAETRQMRLREAMVRQQSFRRLGAPLPGGAGGAAAAAAFVGTGFQEDECSD